MTVRCEHCGAAPEAVVAGIVGKLDRVFSPTGVTTVEAVLYCTECRAITPVDRVMVHHLPGRWLAEPKNS